jgi:GNAT superfamily N-acetyltransferase
MGERPALFLGLLADQPELIAEVGVLRWDASGEGSTPGAWIEATARDAGRDCLPTTLVAMGLDGRAIGALTLGATDERAGEMCGARRPWLVGMVVRQGERRCGVGRLMVRAAEDLAREQGHDRVWVAAAADDVAFFRHCGWDDVEAPDPGAGQTSVRVLAKDLTGSIP